MFGHAFADTVTDRLLELLTTLKLPVSKLLSISTDGPNVNKAIKKKLDLTVIKVSIKFNLTLQIPWDMYGFSIMIDGKNLQQLVYRHVI